MDGTLRRGRRLLHHRTNFLLLEFKRVYLLVRMEVVDLRQSVMGVPIRHLLSQTLAQDAFESIHADRRVPPIKLECHVRRQLQVLQSLFYFVTDLHSPRPCL